MYLGKDTPEVSSKRQITVVGKEAGAAEGILRHLDSDSRITDEQSRQRANAE
ncbi:MAG: hypothetical protein R3E86_19040 [Pseudomonadales bacterium]